MLHPWNLGAIAIVAIGSKIALEFTWYETIGLFWAILGVILLVRLNRKEVNANK